MKNALVRVMRLLVCWLTLSLSTPCLARGQELEFAQPVQLTGFLRSAVFYGPPGYGETPTIDRLEHVLLLQLPDGLCLQVPEANAFAGSECGIALLQVIPSSVPPGVVDQNLPVALQGRLLRAVTGHHRTAIVVEARRMAKAPIPDPFALYPVAGVPPTAPDFAGTYDVLTTGCGTSCRVHTIVDAESGDTIDTVSSTVGVEYRSDSRVLVVNPPRDLRPWCFPEAAIRGVSYTYVLERRLVLMDSVVVCQP
jgi:hypothetical protein